MRREAAVELNIIVAVLCEPDVADIARHNRQLQRAALKILSGRQHAGGDPAVVDEAVLHRAHKQVDAFSAQTMALRLVGNSLQR
ncbi:hypothetical protein D3C81_1570040 [compost metagenome]